MSTARDLIKGALRLIGAIATGENPSADEISDGLNALNDMVDSWSNEGLTIHQRVREEFTLIPDTQEYTLGIGGNFNTSRPMKIEYASIQMNSGDVFEIPIDVINFEQWSQITQKNTLSSIPTKLFCAGTYPLERVSLWPVPSEANKLVLYSWKPLSAFTSANTEVSFPEGYKRALRYNLAVELSPEYGKDPMASVVNSAREAKENIKRMNIRPHYLAADGAIRGNKKFNIYSGDI